MVVHISVLAFLIMSSFFFFIFLQREHYLIFLFTLELIIMVLIFIIPITGASYGTMSTPVVLVLLTMGACEARVGLSVIVFVVRFYGNDLMCSFSMGGA